MESSSSFLFSAFMFSCEIVFKLELFSFFCVDELIDCFMRDLQGFVVFVKFFQGS